MKKIHSEIKIENNLLNIKLATTDKKNPTTMFIDGGVYISPLLDKRIYTEDIKSIEKELKGLFTGLWEDESQISVIEVADTRIEYGKKSYLSFQSFFKTPQSLMAKQNFVNIIQETDVVKKYKDILPKMVKIIESNGFKSSKTKK